MSNTVRATVVALLTQSDVAELISQIGSRASALQADIHQAACSTLDHARAHGDWTGITRLMDALPNGQRVKALGYWFSRFSNGVVSLSKDKDGAWKVNKDRFSKRTDSDFQVSDAMEITFADLTAEKDPQTATLETLLKSLKKYATNAENFDGTDIPKVAPSLRAVASQLVPLVERATAELKQAA